MVEHRLERAVVAGDVEQPERLAVQAEVGPREDLEQLLERPDPARERDERVGELGHERLALVHRVDDPQVADAVVADLEVDDLARDHARDVPARRHRGVGERAHHPDVRAAVDEAHAALRERAADVDGGLM